MWFEILICSSYFGRNRVSFFFFKTFCCIFNSSYDIYIREYFRSNCEMRSFARRSVLIWVNCLEDINNPFLFISFVGSTLCFFFLLSNLSVSIYASILLRQKSLYTYLDESFLSDRQVIYIGPKILPSDCIVLFLSLSHLTWLIYIYSPIQQQLINTSQNDCTLLDICSTF